MKNKILVIPYLVVFGQIVNYYIEFYATKLVCKSRGIQAANGWHIAPNYELEYKDKPYHSTYVTPKELEKLKTKYNIEFLR